jgi:hypothetical protein
MTFFTNYCYGVRRSVIELKEHLASFGVRGIYHVLLFIFLLEERESENIESEYPNSIKQEGRATKLFISNSDLIKQAKRYQLSKREY